MTKIKGLYYIVILPDDTQVHITSRESLNVGDQIFVIDKLSEELE